jgi:DUF4097 and DUF4098 domain-containing protein YvlB
MRHLLRLSVAAVAAAAMTPAPAHAQVYPDRVLVKTHSTTVAYQRRSRDDNRAEQTERTTKTFKLGSDGSLDLGTLAGDITVSRGSGPDTTVEIVKVARGHDADEIKSQLGLVDVDISEGAGRVQIKARYPNRMHGNADVTMSFNVTAPAGTRLTANSMSGTIKITDIKGDISANTISGDITISGAARVSLAKTISGTIDIADVKTDGALEAATVNGDVRLRHVSARRISGGTISGDVKLEDIDSANVSAHTMNGEITFGGALARQGRYEFNTQSGDVRLTLTGNIGFQIEANSFSGDVRSDYPITTHGTADSGGMGRHRTILRGTYGDGSAVVNVTTFSGSIVVGKK